MMQSGGLGGEQTRWEAAADAAAADLVRLPGDTLLASASLAYLPPHIPHIRSDLNCIAPGMSMAGMSTLWFTFPGFLITFHCLYGICSLGL